MARQGPPAAHRLRARVLDGERERFANGIGEDEAEDLLRRDAAIAERAVPRLITVPLTDGQFDALVSFVFNVGAGGLQRSTLRRKVNREEHALVPAEFMKWIWAGGRKLQGLVRRREAEARCYIGSPAPGRASAAQGRQ
jgi:GH24 family phage-related lysozyme (muramidase)